MVETTYDLRYNIAAFVIAICSIEFVLPEKAFSILEEKDYKLCDKDTLDMVEMSKEMSYREVGNVYGLDKNAVYGRVRRYKAKKKSPQTAI